MTIQNPEDTPQHSSAMDAEQPGSEEGVRYALLQRLAPALQHHIMGHFQSMDMIAAMMQRRLQSAEPDMESIRRDCASLCSASQTAVNSVVNMMSWVEPKPAATARLDAAIKECVGLLATQFRFRGFAIVNEALEIDVGVSSRSLRSVLGGTLIALSDLSQAPADLVIQARAMPDSVHVSITLRATERKQKNIYATTHRLLQWRDVQTLATAEAVQLKHDETGAQLIFTRRHEIAAPGSALDPKSDGIR